MNELIGTTPAIQAVREDVECAARCDTKVLITGESGVGKEVVADMIQRRSERCRAPMVRINCAGLLDSVLQSELFGHVRGSFTGAYRDKPGLLETAHRGTLFLDEIGDMSLQMQALLLRFLETGEGQRLGHDGPQRSIDVRTIAATNRNLVERIAAKEFRADLHYRLNVICVAVPPLRDRKADIPMLARHFLQHYTTRYRTDDVRLTPEVLNHLVEYDWPGNVRELKNVMERLAVRAARGKVEIGDLRVPTSALDPVQKASAERSAAASGMADVLVDRMLKGGESFWSVVYLPFMGRDVTRDTLRHIVNRGLQRTCGNYSLLLQLFNMEGTDYRRFLAFLRKYDCHPAFQQFRNSKAALAFDRGLNRIA